MSVSLSFSFTLRLGVCVFSSSSFSADFCFSVSLFYLVPCSISIWWTCVGPLSVHVVNVVLLLYIVQLPYSHRLKCCCGLACALRPRPYTTSLLRRANDSRQYNQVSWGVWNTPNNRAKVNCAVAVKRSQQYCSNIVILQSHCFGFALLLRLLWVSFVFVFIPCKSSHSTVIIFISSPYEFISLLRIKNYSCDIACLLIANRKLPGWIQFWLCDAI